MSIKNWLAKNTASLAGKTVAVSGSTGGLGKELCSYLASLGASLILLDRSRERSEAHASELSERFGVRVKTFTLDLSEFESVRSCTEQLKDENIDILIHNAGAYSIPRKICDTGYDNVFQINFASPYYMTRELLPLLRQRSGRVVAVGSIAHNYSKIDENDLDFRTRTASSKVYGNSKRHLMFSLYSLFENEDGATLSVVHPGITFTNITAHYPKLIFALIKHPMKIIFMKPKKAALCLIKGVFEQTARNEWIGPRFLNIWGLPGKKSLKTCSDDEISEISKRAEEVYTALCRLDIKEKL